MMKQRISILGCGWLGLPLAKVLVAKGCLVLGSTTKADKIALLEANGIQPFLIELNPAISGKNIAEFLDTDVLFINIPPKITLNGLDFNIKQLESLLGAIQKPPQKVVFISSTSVYSDLNREVFENDASPKAHPVLMQAEAMLQQHFDGRCVVLRPAGLMGPDRYPAKYFAGKKGLTIGDIPVNYVHQHDVAAICAQVILSQNIPNGVFNVVAPEHPKRRDVYHKNCLDFGLEAPEFVDAAPQDFKIVNGQKIIQTLDYQFKFPNPLTFDYGQNDKN